MNRLAITLPGRALCVLAAALLSCCVTHAANAACSKTFTVAVGPYPPYVYRDAHRQWTGIDIEMARAIFREAGCTLAYAESMPALRYMVLFKQGKIDLMLGASDTEDRRQYAVFSTPYRFEDVALFALAED